MRWVQVSPAAVTGRATPCLEGYSGPGVAPSPLRGIRTLACQSSGVSSSCLVKGEFSDLKNGLLIMEKVLGCVGCLNGSLFRGRK